MAEWHKVTEKQPPEPGYYTVHRRGYGRKITTDSYYWNGGYWITHRHAPTQAVEEWLEADAEEGEEHERS